VIEAIAAGKKAAIMIDKYLRKQELAREYKKTRPSLYIPPVELTEEELEKARRPVVRVVPVNKRAKNFNEVDLTLSQAKAVGEARRCLRCDLQTEDGKEWLKQVEQDKG
jgi:NADH-quinone oxidoreductase subunit F